MEVPLRRRKMHPAQRREKRGTFVGGGNECLGGREDFHSVYPFQFCILMMQPKSETEKLEIMLRLM